MTFAIIFFCLLIAAYVLSLISINILLSYLIISLITFCAFAIDKSAARKSKWRTKERTLHLLALLCGWPGALLAQQLLRHKTQKQPFKNKLYLVIIINILLLYILLFPPTFKSTL
ncbi:DUF1294 domain-containing protein [uncultured Shewanella sp.]|uniref:DUF1294 domain-containing protein n=1 Tax=uncultured Shewanella sp. TaxID=173975 RepID=UPI00261AFFB0|nr:DUF1294 domain-containing protein [uncultured Shewanella sp.]